MKKQLIRGLSLLTAGILLAGCAGQGSNQQENNGTSDEPASQAQTAEASDSAYSVLVVDESDNPVPGVTVQFCDDTTCNLGTTDDSGVAVFETEAPGIFTVHMLDIPEGYAEDETEYVTEDTYGQIKVVLKSSSAPESNAEKQVLTETGFEVVLPEKMQDLHGTLSWIEYTEEKGVAFARLDYIGRTPEETAEYERRYEEALDNRDNEELVNDFIAYMEEYDNTINTIFFYVCAVNNGESIDEILNRAPEEIALSEYIGDTLDLGKKGDYQYYLLAVDQDKLFSLAYASEDEIPVPEKEIADEYASLKSVDINEFAKGITLIEAKPVNPLAVGDVVEFEGTDFEGNAVSSKDLFAGHTLTMVNLWGTWCHWCVEELPDLESYSKDLEEQGSHLIGVCQDGVKKKDKAQELLSEAGVTYTNVIIEDYDAAFPKVSGYPTTYIVDGNGVIVSIIEGADFDGYKTAVEEALKSAN